MRILEIGKKQEIDRIFVCPYCGTKFAAAAGDMNILMGGSFVKCPICEEELEWSTGSGINLK